MSTSGVGGDALTQAGRLRASMAARKPAGTRDYGGLNEQAILEPLDIPEATDRQMAHRVADLTMRRAHGCTGPACAHTGHGDGRRDMHSLLAALGLFRYATGPDPLGLREPLPSITDAWGLRKQTHRGKPAGPAT